LVETTLVTDHYSIKVESEHPLTDNDVVRVSNQAKLRGLGNYKDVFVGIEFTVADLNPPEEIQVEEAPKASRKKAAAEAPTEPVQAESNGSPAEEA
jgi:hypothetical protein